MLKMDFREINKLYKLNMNCNVLNTSHAAPKRIKCSHPVNALQLNFALRLQFPVLFISNQQTFIRYSKLKMMALEIHTLRSGLVAKYLLRAQSDNICVVGWSKAS